MKFNMFFAATVLSVGVTSGSFAGWGNDEEHESGFPSARGVEQSRIWEYNENGDPVQNRDNVGKPDISDDEKPGQRKGHNK